MVDVHCHLNFKPFANDYDTVIKEALESGVSTIINVGTQIDSSKRAIELAEKYPQLFAIVGVHPHHADKIELGTEWINELKKLAKHEKVLAIGEIGMDNYRYQSNGIVDPVTQKEIFEKQVELAQKLQLPLQIHNRHAGKEILEVLQHYKAGFQNPPGMFHCFSGDIPFLKKVLELGFYIGFDGNITYVGLAPGESATLRELATYAPLDRIVTETDSPYLTPIPHRGSRNKPSYVILVGEFLRQLKGISFEDLDRQTSLNAKTVFPRLQSK